MLSQQTQLESRKRRKKRSKKAQTSKYKIRVRYKYHHYRWISTDEVESRASRLILRIEPAEIKVVRSSNQTIAEKDLEARRRADREGLGLLPTLPREPGRRS